MNTTDKIKKIVLLGSKPLGAKILETLYRTVPENLQAAITFDDSADTRCALDEFKSVCTKHNIPLYVAKNPRQANNLVRECKPDFCLVVCWYWLLPEALLKSVPLGFAGIHYSLLPKYRGGSPLVWSLINGETTIGLSLFELATKMDAGNIWTQKSVEINDHTTIAQALTLLEQKSVEVVEQNIKGILSGTLTPTPQDHTKATVVPQRKPHDGFVDWTKSALEIHRFIRAQSSPYPGALSTVGGVEIEFESSFPTEQISAKPAGSVEKTQNGQLFVVCGDKHLICIDEFRPNGDNILITTDTVFDTHTTGKTP